MKKIVLSLLAAFTLMGCAQTPANPDGVKFKEEYEALNGTTNSRDKEYPKMEIDKNNPIVYADLDQILEVIDTEGIIYFGFPECPWCRNAVPVLLEAAKELEVDKIYYYNAKDGRDSLELVDGEIVVKKEKGEDYQKLYEALYDTLPVYDGLEDETIKRLYFPTFYFIKEGEVREVLVGTESIIPEYEDPYTPMTQEMHDKFLIGLKDAIKKMRVAVCEEEAEKAC